MIKDKPKINKKISDCDIKNKLNHKDKLILQNNKNFFDSNKKYLAIMLKIIKGETPISIRVLEWFVANYSKQYGTWYRIKKNEKVSVFRVNEEYNNQLIGFSKDYFDPFCRKVKIKYKFNDIYFETSVAQLNFFKWALKNKVIKYLERHLKEIDNDMKHTHKMNKKRKEEATRKAVTTDSSESEETSDKLVTDTELDQSVCSSKSINSITISYDSPHKKKKKSSRGQRKQLCKSIFEKGIVKYDSETTIDFSEESD
jgi:hypothetical protein